MNNKKFEILIAHQSTIPHYRVDFYRAVQKKKPDWWNFTVIYDAQEAKSHFYLESDISRFNFPIQGVKSFIINIFGRKLIFQSFPFTSFNYDLLVVGNAMNNISYPLSFYRKIFGKKIAYWGHGKDVLTEERSGLKNFTDSFKIVLSKLSDGFFAYTNGVKNYLVERKVEADKIFVLQNTINIINQRKSFNDLKAQREMFRRELGLENKKVLLYVGRFNKEKKLEFLISAFEKLLKTDSSFKLVVIGGGDKSLIAKIKSLCGEQNVMVLGVISEEDISKYYVVSDVFVFPGAVGLAPLQAMCYDIPSIVIHSLVHSPEYEYLNSKNSIILRQGCTPKEYADEINDLFTIPNKLSNLRSSTWESIEHLTIENMAQNFIQGINQILRTKL